MANVNRGASLKQFAIAITLSVALLAGCGGSSKSLSAADDAIRVSDDFVRAVDDFEPPWSVVPDAPPPSVVREESIAPAVSRSRSVFSTTLDDLKEADLTELVETAVCALLKYQLEYSAVPVASSIEEYLEEVSDARGLLWVTAEDEQILASELENLGNEIAAHGLSSYDFMQLAANACDALP